MVELWLIRHGVTKWNEERRWQGHADIPLNEVGHHQARAVAAYLLQVCATVPFDALLSSDLSRARMTATAVGEMLNLPVEEDSRFREEHYGLLEGHTSDEIRRDPTLSAALHAREQGHPTSNDSGESRQAALDRAALALDYVRTNFGDKQRIAVFTHGGFILNCYRHVHGYPAAYPVVKEKKCPKIANTSISILRTAQATSNQAWTALEWGSTPNQQH